MIALCRDEIRYSFVRSLAVFYVLHNFDSGITCKKFISTKRIRSFVLPRSCFALTKFSHVIVSAYQSEIENQFKASSQKKLVRAPTHKITFFALVWFMQLPLPRRFTTLHHFFHINFFCQNLRNILAKKFIFGNIASYMTATLLKREVFLRHFSRIFPTNSVGKIIEHLFLRKSF